MAKPPAQDPKTGKNRKPSKGERTPGSGRAPGTPNKLNAEAKAAIEEVFVGLGGARGLLAWAEANREAFYTKIFTRIIPTNIQAQFDGKVTLEDLIGGSFGQKEPQK